MTNTIEEAVAYAQANPTRDGGDWEGWCESFVFRAGGFSQSFASAMAAGDASGYLNPDVGSAPRGAIHYFAGAGGSGHVCFELGGNLLLMASSAVTDSFGESVGEVTFSAYQAKMNLPYRGWSLFHGSEQLAPSTPVGSVIERKKNNMGYPVLIQNTEVGTPSYGLVVRLGDNGEYHWLTAAQRDAYVEHGVEVWTDTSGHFEYFLSEQDGQRTYLSGLFGTSIPAPAQPDFTPEEITALAAGITSGLKPTVP